MIVADVAFTVLIKEPVIVNLVQQIAGTND
jgi:hypothetical protein